MKVLKSNNVTCFDVDKTLISDIYSNLQPQSELSLEYGGEKVHFTAHKTHIRFLKHCKSRGDYIIIWSQNGYQWAEKVVYALHLQEYVDIIMSKPSRYVDDKENPTDIIGNRIFLGEK